jgi:large subunit ribosomal protein L17
MRHNKKINHLGRKHAHRNAMLSNMASSLIMHKRIKTTVPKAKALRSFVEPLITKSKVDSTHSRRVVFSYLQNKHSVSELFRDVAVKVGDRPGGYTRILKIGSRMGDNAEMCIIELVDYNENMLKDSKSSKSSSSRRRRKKKSTTDAQPQAQTPKNETAAEVVAEEPKAENAEKEVKEETPKAEVKKETKKEPKAEANAETAAKEEKPKTEAKKKAAPKKESKPEAEEDKKDAEGTEENK